MTQLMEVMYNSSGVCVCVCERERENERQRKIKREREREETDENLTDRHIHIHRQLVHVTLLPPSLPQDRYDSSVAIASC